MSIKMTEYSTSFASTLFTCGYKSLRLIEALPNVDGRHDATGAFFQLLLSFIDTKWIIVLYFQKNLPIF